MQKKLTPLPERMRPKSLETYIGQQHLVAPGMPIYNFIQAKKLPSIIFWGPPGIGKTTLAKILAKGMDLQFFQISAINSSVKEIREIIALAKKIGEAILFIDEIHRFNKSQQDSLLKAVEEGTITLIGATTENPSFEVISALLSRAQVFTLKHLEKTDLDKLIASALKNDTELSKLNIKLEETDALMGFSGGDARKLLNLLEIIVNAQIANKEIVINDKFVKEKLSQFSALYDKDGEQHYDTISAFIKSIRGSDPNAALYYMARMLNGGEDPKFIARRLLILASEDIGNANPTALIMANNCFQAINVIGMPESAIILSQAVTYLASSPKSNASYLAIKHAQKIANETANAPIPLYLRNAPTKLMKQLDYGKDYKYAHDFEGGFVNLEFMPKGLEGTKFWEPNNTARENALRKYLKENWKEKYNY
ncbi:MAG: replication-associated recombination protein A [Chitinophagales bacterium]